MISILMLGSVINYLTRSTLAVAAPTLLKDLHVTEQQYSWILNTFQGAIMLQPLCGYLMDAIGLKLAFAIFAIAWSVISMAHGLVHNWQMLAGLRGLLGLAEGSANPAGMKADGGMVSGQGARLRRRSFQYWCIGRFYARSSTRRFCHLLFSIGRWRLF
jgi:ACS family hexuronate transporter-like MFS transporter